MSRSSAEGPKRTFAVIGTGGRCAMYVDALLTTHADVGDLAALVDTNPKRMALYRARIESADRARTVALYSPDSIDRMYQDVRPDAVIITSPDFTHADYIVGALDRDVDVICEKPMTIDAPSLQRIVTAAERSSARLVVTFNYRYSPRNAMLRTLIAEGRIGAVTSVHFEWCLDTVHGADYFRRWHRDKAKSGGLLVHKSTHHFDLVNWWIGDVPSTVYALGGLRFYGRSAAASRGLGDRPALGRDAVRSGDPFVLDLAANPALKALYLDPEDADGYHRDRDVFSDGISIEDNLTLAVGYSSGASMAYTLNAHSPWEGYRVAVNGTKGRVELEVVERAQVSAAQVVSGRDIGLDAPVIDPSAEPDAAAIAEGIRPWGTRLVLQPHWEPPQLVDIPEHAGSHGGGDAMLLDDVFRGPGDDPLRRQAGYLDGVRSVIVGVSANRSLETGQVVATSSFGLELG